MFCSMFSVHKRQAHIAISIGTNIVNREKTVHRGGESN